MAVEDATDAPMQQEEPTALGLEEGEVPPPPAPLVSQRRKGRGRAGGQGLVDKVCRPRGGDLEQADWMLSDFKTAKCNLQGSQSSHDHRCCPFYHNERDRRRAVVVDGKTLYVGEPCPDQFDDTRVCPRGDACGMCHSTAELLYHPDFFRKRLCHQSRQCPRSRYCAFAHARQELLVPHFTDGEEADPSEDFIIHRFKTQWCPIGGPHDWESCVYAHTYRDWRRVPSLGYSSHPCPRWASSVSGGPAELSYEQRCPNGFACPLAHGAKEQLYHPKFYKTGPCSDSNCRRAALCAFTHGEPPLPREEDSKPAGSRKPIPNAHKILNQCQPTYTGAPAYHALDEAPKSGAGSRGRGRRARGGASAPSSAPAPLQGPTGTQRAAPPPAFSAAAPHLAPLPSMMQGVPFQHYFPMMPMADPLRLPMGTRGCPTGAPMGALGSPPVASSMGTLGCPTSIQVPMFPGTLGAPQCLMAQQMHPMGAAIPQTVQQQLPTAVPVVQETGGEDFPPLPGSSLLNERIFGSGAAAVARKRDKSGLVDLAAWRHKYTHKDGGWRTPSSFGSPPLSGLPTASTSPRDVDAGGAWKSWGLEAAAAGEDPNSETATFASRAASEGALTPRASAASFCAPVAAR